MLTGLVVSQQSPKNTTNKHVANNPVNNISPMPTRRASPQYRGRPDTTTSTMEPFKAHSSQPYTPPPHHLPDTQFVNRAHTHALPPHYMVPVYQVAGYTTPSRMTRQLLSRPAAVAPYIPRPPTPAAVSAPHGVVESPPPHILPTTCLESSRPRSARPPSYQNPRQHVRPSARHSPLSQAARHSPIAARSPRHTTVSMPAPEVNVKQSPEMVNVMNEMAVLKRQVYNLTERGNEFARELARLRGENEQMRWEGLGRPAEAGGKKQEEAVRVERVEMVERVEAPVADGVKTGRGTSATRVWQGVEGNWDRASV